MLNEARRERNEAPTAVSRGRLPAACSTREESPVENCTRNWNARQRRGAARLSVISPMAAPTHAGRSNSTKAFRPASPGAASNGPGWRSRIGSRPRCQRLQPAVPPPSARRRRRRPSSPWPPKNLDCLSRPSRRPVAHLADADLFQPFFQWSASMRPFSGQRSTADGTPEIAAVLTRAERFSYGYRPIAILETRPQGEPYDHERIRPCRCIFKGRASAAGRYRDLVAQALEILSTTDGEPARRRPSST